LGFRDTVCLDTASEPSGASSTSHTTTVASHADGHASAPASQPSGASSTSNSTTVASHADGHPRAPAHEIRGASTTAGSINIASSPFDPYHDPANTDHALLGDVLGFDAAGRGLWDDSDLYPDDPVPFYKDMHGHGIDLEYLTYLRSAGLTYYGKDGAPHDFEPYRSDAFAAFMEPFWGPKDMWHAASEGSEHEALNETAALPSRSWAAVARDSAKGSAPTAPAA
jgi:hypothetical protein